MLTISLSEDEYDILKMLTIQEMILPLARVDLPILRSIDAKLEEAKAYENSKKNFRG